MIDCSVVVPTRDRRDRLERLLMALDRQTLAAECFEVVVVDDGSEDGTAEILAEWHRQAPERHRVRTTTGRGPAVARNTGILEARGRIVAFTDDDCEPEPGWLAALVQAPDQGPEFAGLGGETLPPENPGLISRYIATQCVMQRPEIKNGEVLHLQTNNAAFLRSVLLEARGFDESYPHAGGEDWDLSRRLRAAGRRLGYAPEARVVHRHRHTLAGFIRTYYHYGQGEAMMLRHESKLRQLLRSVYRLRFFFTALLIPFRILAFWPKKDFSLSEIFIFPFLESLREFVHHLGYFRRLPSAILARPPFTGSLPASGQV
jgi:glycosyltransferase involved in cell wall biosynthesis